MSRPSEAEPPDPEQGDDRHRAEDDPPSSPLSDPVFVAGLRPIPSGPIAEGECRPAADLVGVAPDGAPVAVRTTTLAGSTGDRRPLLVAFLHTRCEGCDEFWRGLRDGQGGQLPGSVDAAIVTKGPGTVAADEVRALCAGIAPVPVVMSDRAWSDYRVMGYPFFALVDRIDGVIVGETVAFGWPDVIAMIGAAGY